MTLLDIAKKHLSKDSPNPPSKSNIQAMQSLLKKQLEIGIKAEMEHTKSKEMAKKITMNHLTETPNYYDKLLKAGL